MLALLVGVACGAPKETATDMAGGVTGPIPVTPMPTSDAAVADAHQDESDIVPSTIAPEISIGDVIRDQIRTGKAGEAKAFLEKVIADRVSNPEARQALNDQVQKAFDGATAPRMPFPVLPFKLLNGAQSIFAGRETQAPPASDKTILDVTKTLAQEETANCKPERPSLVPASAGISKGVLPDPKTSDCALFRTQKLAAILNNLALERVPGSELVDGSMRMGTLSAVVDYLIDSGHTIRVENNRYFADFLGFWYDGRSVAAPVWIDTGIPVPGGEKLTVPAPHSGYTFHIRGPKFDGTLEFFLGTDGGASFRPVSGMHRAMWAGERSVHSYSARTDRRKTKETFLVAGALRARWTDEGANKALQGYGVLGVCNDSTSVVELVIEGTGPTLFPLARLAAPAEAVRSPLDQKVRDAISALPRDVQDFAVGKDDTSAIARIRSTMPMAMSELQVRYPTLATQLVRLQ